MRDGGENKDYKERKMDKKCSYSYFTIYSFELPQKIQYNDAITPLSKIYFYAILFTMWCRVIRASLSPFRPR